MIDTIRGTVHTYIDGYITLGIGPITGKFAIPDSYNISLNTEVTLYLYLHWNMEQGPTLYSFLYQLDRTLFSTIISCNGIGPRLALSMLSHFTSDHLIRIIQDEDCRTLSSINGIGVKKAEQLCVQLKHKIEKIPLPEAEGNTKPATWHTAAEALRALSYTPQEISGAIKKVKQELQDQEPPFDIIMRRALALLSQRRISS